MLVEFAVQWTFNFSDQLDKEIHEMGFSTNIDKTTVIYKKSHSISKVNNTHISNIQIIDLITPDNTWSSHNFNRMIFDR